MTADAKEKYCGQIDPSLTFISNPVVGTVLTNGEVIGFSGSLTRVPGEGVGFYNILEGTVANNNYAITYVGAQLEIKGVSIDASASSNPVPQGSVATLSAKVTDINGVEVPLVSVIFEVTNEQGTTVEIGPVSTNNLGVATSTTSALSLGVYMVVAKAGSGCATSTAYIPVYDASGSFVTGGGWIFSPSGALVGTTITGKANFGFNAQYKKGKNNVTELDGNTNFQFSEGDFHFKSSSYENMTLVISGAKATYRGFGTVNGTGDYGFMVTAIDGQINGGGGLDKFRIKIWDRSNGNTVVYDNEIGKFENVDASTALGGGSIVIHEVKTNAKTKSAEIATAIEPTVELADLKVYPNPFSEKLRFEFVYPESVNARIDLYDMTGRMVKTIFEQPIEGGVSYNAEFKPETVISGMYIYRMTMGEAVYNGKVVFRKE